MNSINSVRKLQILYFSKKTKKIKNLKNEKKIKKKWPDIGIYTYYSKQYPENFAYLVIKIFKLFAR